MRPHRAPEPSRPLPAWAAGLLAIAPLGDRRADAEGDLAELFDDRVARYGHVYAYRRLLSDILSLWRGAARGGTMLMDLRFGLRLVSKHLVPVVITMAGLALAIGVASAVFSLVNVTMLRPYGMDDPSSVVSIASPRHGGWSYWPYATFLQMRKQSTLTTVEASELAQVRVAAAPAADNESRRWMQFVSGGYLPTLGARPAIGRALGPSDDLPGAPAVIVASHYFWATELNGDPLVVGKTMWVNGAPATLVGVLRADFTGPVKTRPSLWAAFAAYDDVLAGLPFEATTRAEVEVIARLKPGVEAAAAQENLSAILNRPGTTGTSATTRTAEPRVELYSAASPIDGAEAAELYSAIGAIFGVLGLVLAVACANAANLLRAAAATRMREIGIRLALGATRRRLIRQLINESVLLGAIAGGVGYLIAVWLAPILAAVIALSPEIDAAPDGRVLLFTIAVAVVCGVAAGISPARFGARGDVLSALQSRRRSTAHGGGRSRFRTSFVGFQAAVSMLLLVVAALLARSAILMTRTDPGFDTDRLIAVGLSMPRKGFDEPGYVDRALVAARGVPSVERAAISQSYPFGPSRESDRFTHQGRSYTLYVIRSDADYFSTAGVRIVRGRTFTPSDVAAEAPLALISANAARAFFGDADPIGQSVATLPAEGGNRAPATIVGIAADTLTSSVQTQLYGTIYLPISRTRANPPSLIVRTANPARAARAVEDALRPLDARVQVTTTIVRDRIDTYLDAKRMLAWLSAPTALLALLLATLGVYGVTTFVVSQRTQEVSVRMAIGASARDVLRLLVQESLRPVLIGLAIGLAGALIVSRVFAAELSGISPHDPAAIAVAAAALLAGAIVAVLIPARRAARLDPAAVLRQV